MKYKSIQELLEMITDSQAKLKLLLTYNKFKPEMHASQGSQHNHQAWQGGYIDHVVDSMNIARLLYQAMNDKRQLEFTLSDALIVLFLHDIEKAFPTRVQDLMESNSEYFTRSKAKSKVRYRVLHEEGLWLLLTPSIANAIDTCEGENNSYTNQQRVMGPLGAFCHMCDTASARIWFDFPKNESNRWGFRTGGESDESSWGV